MMRRQPVKNPIRNSTDQWVQQAFLLKPGSITEAEHARRIYSEAAWTYIDTTLGGNFSLNNLSQYTKFADIKTGGLTSPQAVRNLSNLKSSGGAADSRDSYISGLVEDHLPTKGNSKGVGRFWYEQHQSNAVYVHLRFGVPRFTSAIQFFGSFYNHGASVMVRKGKVSQFAYTAGKLLGGIALLPFQPFILGGRAIRFWTDMPNTKFYTLKPDMSNYWHAVNSIANALAVNLGLIPTWSRMGNAQYEGGEKAAQKTTYLEYLESWRKESTDKNSYGASTLLGNWEGTYMGAQHNFSMQSGKAGDGGMWTDGGGGVDVRAIAMRGQGLAYKHLKIREEYMEKNEPGNIESFRRHYIEGIEKMRAEGHHLSQPMEDYIQSYLKMPYYNLNNNNSQDQEISEFDHNGAAYNVDGGDPHLNSTLNQQIADGGGGSYQGDFGTDNKRDTSSLSAEDQEKQKGLIATIQNWIGSAKDYTNIALDEGAEFITFKVDNPGTMSESFSTTTRESDIASKINATSTSMRNMRFNIAGGIGEKFNAALGLVTDVAMGLADSVGLAGLATLGGNGFVDIPEMVDQTSAQLPSASYTIQLRSAYGNPLSMMHKLYIPLACLLAGALPRSTGPASYTAPFICQLFSRGRQLTRLGVIKSMTISRGQGNIGWTADGRPLGIDVTFEVADLSKVLHMPIAAKLTAWDTAVGKIGELLGIPGIANAFAPSMYNEDSSYTDYLAVLGSLGIHETLLSNNARWAIKVANRRANVASQNAPSAFAVWLTEDVMLGNVVKNLIGFSALDR